MARGLIPGKLVSFILVLIGLLGSSQVAVGQTRAYVANFGSNSVSVIDTSSNTVVATVPVGNQPYGATVSPDGTRVYVANCGGDLFVIATSTNTVAARVVVGGCPYSVAITPDGTRVYVVRDNASSVWVIDTSSNTVVAKVNVAATPGAVAITPDGTRAYVASVGTLTVPAAVSVIDTSSNTVVATVEVGGLPLALAFTPDGTRAYVTYSVPSVPPGAGGVAVIDTSSNAVVARVSVPNIGVSQFSVAITPDGTRAYVVTFGPSGASPVNVIDTSSNTVVATVSAGIGSSGVAITPDGTRAYVTAATNVTGIGNGAVAVIDTSSNTVVATVGVGSTPMGVAIAKGGGGTPLIPAIAPGGIVPLYGSAGIIQSGEWASIFGSNLASSRVSWAGNFPTSLGGTSVKIDGKAAYLSFVSPGQINFQVPNDTTTGAVPVVVTTTGGSSTSNVMLARFGPTFFLLDARHVAAIILRSDGSGAYGGGSYDIVGPTGTSLGYGTVAAKAGDVIEIFGTGFGPTNPAVPAGQAFSGAAPTTNPISLRINNVSVTTSFAGLSGPGLYQLNLTVPPGLGRGDVSLQAAAGGAQTPSGVVISLQ